MKKLYENIKLRRLFLGLTQAELAQRVGYADHSNISLIEKGELDLPQSKIVLFAKALNCSPAELMGWVEIPVDSGNISGLIISPDEADVLTKYRDLDVKEQAKLLLYLDKLKDK